MKNLIAYFEDELHLSRLTAVHLCFFQYLVILGVGSLSDVQDAPCQCYTQIKVVRHYFLFLKHGCLSIGLVSGEISGFYLIDLRLLTVLEGLECFKEDLEGNTVLEGALWVAYDHIDNVY